MGIGVTAPGDDGIEGSHAMVDKWLATSQGADLGRTERNGAIQSATDDNRNYNIDLQQHLAAIHRQDLFGQRTWLL